MRRPSFVLRRLPSILIVLAVAGCSSAATTYLPRPYRFESPAPVPHETQRLAQRMSARPGLKPVFVDPTTGTIFAAWSSPASGASADSSGARAWFHVHRYRAFVRPNGWASTVFVDLEEIECDQRGFQWTETQVFGNCRPVTNVTEQQLRALDELGASLRG
jgi:hypothetical protein